MAVNYGELEVTATLDGEVTGDILEGAGEGTTNYNYLTHKPSINDVELVGNKTLEELGIATTLADLEGDEEHRTVTDEEILYWNNKSNFSGDYNDLQNKPTIPTKLADLDEDINHQTITSAERAIWNHKADKNEIPDTLSDLDDDQYHRLVTDAEKNTWNNKPDEISELDDVNISDILDGQVLKYDSATGKFINANESGGIANAYTKIKVADTLIEAAGEDVFELVAGSNVTLTPDSINKKVTINSTGGGGTSTGDMLKAVYDTNNDGIVDSAETLNGLESSVNELNYVKGVTSGIQGQLNGKAEASDIPNDLADLNDDSTHRLVTDVEKQTWNAKSDFSGSYNDLTNKPTIPDPQVQADWNQAVSSAVDYIKNKPTIPSALSDLTDDSTHRTVTDTEKGTWDAKADVGDIPTVNNSTITIQKNGQNVDSFTLNQNTNKVIDITVPTKVSDILNDAGFITSTVDNLANYYLKSQTYTQTEVDNLIDAAVNGRFKKVNVLPVTGEPNIIYLVPKATPETSNACDEYIWQDNAWELIGSTEIDLSDYVKDDDLNTALADYLTTSAFNTAIANYYTKTEVGNLLDGKVDKVSGKGLSTYDYDATAKGIVDNVTTNLANKVDKVSGKGLSTNDYDATAKAKVDALGTASTKNVPASGNASATEVVMGNDTRLSNSRPASDVYPWAKESTKPTYTKSEVGLGNVDNTSDSAKKTAFTGTIADENTGFVTGGDVYTALDGKVDKVTGKGLSTNDFTNEDKDKLDTSTTELTGNPISFSTLTSQNATEMSVDLEPIQDLHGYDKPWTGGAGKNKLPMILADIKSANTSGTWSGNSYTYNGVTFTVKTDSDGNVTEIALSGTASANAPFSLFTSYTFPSGSYLLSSGRNKNSGYIQIISNSYRSYTDAVEVVLSEPTTGNAFIRVDSGTDTTGLSFYPMLRLSTEADPTFKPYTNICPISGRTEIGILEVGKNILKFDVEDLKSKNTAGIWNGNNYTYNGVLHEFNNNNTLTVGRVSTNGNWAILNFGSYTLKAGRYTVSTGFASNDVMLTVRWDNPNGSIIVQTTNGDASFTLSNDSVVNFSLGFRPTYTGTNILVKPMLYIGDYATTFEPYTKSNDLTIQFGQTVYGGSLDVKRGILTITHGIVDMSTLTWNFNNTYNCWTSTLSNSICRSNDLPINGKADRYEILKANGYAQSHNPSTLMVNTNKTFLADNGSNTDSPIGQLAYELATPIIIQLTPNEISLLKGVNNISTTGDTINLEYRTGEMATLGDLKDAIDDTRYVYSTKEQVVATWIDGRPVYEKVVDFGAGPAASSMKYADFNVPNLDFIVMFQAVATTTAETDPLPMEGTATIWHNNEHGIGSWGQKDISSRHVYVIIRYVKTTD